MPLYIDQDAPLPVTRLIDHRGREIVFTEEGFLPIVVGAHIEREFVVPVLNSDAYDAGDVVSTALTYIPEVTAAPGDSCTIVSMLILDGDYQNAALELWLFRKSVTVGAADAAHSISDPELPRVATVIPSGPYYLATAGSVSINDTLTKNIFTAADEVGLWALVVTRGTPTYTIGNVRVRLSIRRT